MFQEAKETGVNAYAVTVEEVYGLDKIEFLQSHENLEIYQKGSTFLMVQCNVARRRRSPSRKTLVFSLHPYLAPMLVSLLDGMAKNYYYFHLAGYARAHILCLNPFYSYLLIPEEKKNIWNELELNPGPHASRPQATALTTRPWLLGLFSCR